MIYCPGLGSSKKKSTCTWCLMQNIEYLILNETWAFQIQKYCCQLTIRKLACWLIGPWNTSQWQYHLHSVVKDQLILEKCTEQLSGKSYLVIKSSPPSATYVSVNWVSIDSDNGLLPVRRQAITWTSARLLPIGPLGVNFNEIWIKIKKLSFRKMHLKLSSVKLFHGSHFIKG